jgi:hypothetical protein
MQSKPALLLRSLWLLVASLVLVFLFAGLTPYRAEWQRGTIGLAFEPNAAGEMVLDPLPGREAALAGIQKGDLLLAVDGAALPTGASVDETFERLRGPHGKAVTLRVRQVNGTENSLTVTRSEQFLAQLAAAGLSLELSQNYDLALSGLVPLLFLGFSAWLIWKGQPAGMFSLLSFTLLLVPYSLNLTGLVPAGADRLGLPWLYALLRAAGLLGLALCLFLFPTGRFFPAWARGLALAIGVWMVPFYATQAGVNLIPSFIIDWVWVLIFALGIAALVTRFRAAETAAAEKGPLRKILLAGVVTLVLYALLWLLNRFLPGAFFSSSAGIWFGMASQLLWSAAAVFLGTQLVFAAPARGAGG